ncbi:MAG: GNAT family N-acetyltransferase [Opitutales bacterium]
MKVHELRTAPPPDLAAALGRFEEQFHYPLGPGRFFRITHGADYPRFFRAMGEGICFVAEREGRVLGVMGAALRPLALPGGEERLAVYFGDVKVDPAARGGRTLLRLARAAMAWVGDRADAAYAVVMDGTGATPTRYTGRLGIPPFSELGKIMVLRLPTSGLDDSDDSDWLTTEERGTACFSRLSSGGYACLGGDPTERSETEPVWLMDSDGRACGRLEDTLRAKRLFADDGAEMRSAHLSCFAYEDLGAGMELLRVALRFAASRGFPDLFVSVPAPDAPAWGEAFGAIEVVLAPATVFGTGLEPAPLWNVNVTEI